MWVLPAHFWCESAQFLWLHSKIIFFHILQLSLAPARYRLPPAFLSYQVSSYSMKRMFYRLFYRSRSWFLTICSAMGPKVAGKSAHKAPVAKKALGTTGNIWKPKVATKWKPAPLSTHYSQKSSLSKLSFVRLKFCLLTCNVLGQTMREIRHPQKSTDLLIPKAAFACLVREILHNNQEGKHSTDKVKRI